MGMEAVRSSGNELPVEMEASNCLGIAFHAGWMSHPALGSYFHLGWITDLALPLRSISDGCSTNVWSSSSIENGSGAADSLMAAVTRTAQRAKAQAQVGSLRGCDQE